MPGILPMKVIKVGTSAQSRIAQACDRCRSKKIRCDGITPCCTQCSNVGFECKTSDKLSRRAFPRGYTESLEERVRALETEVKELKDLLDEKDEKIDILLKIHSGSRRPSHTPPHLESKPTTPRTEAENLKEDTFRVLQSPDLLDDAQADSYFMGTSSGRAFVDTFRLKVQESGKPCADFKTSVLFGTDKRTGSSPSDSQAGPASTKVPARLVSDQLINNFFQELAPMFPVLHRPTFLDTYTSYVSNPEGMEDQHAIAQLNLVFGIAALSAEWNKQSTAAFESQWHTALDSIQSEHTLATLQCLVLAQIYCIQRADYKRLLHYRGMAISLSHRLGLHQSQKRFSLWTLTVETRKRVFWTLYTLDCFSAALLGLPTLLNDSDIHTEYPESMLPGEPTRLCSALALFRGSRILSKVLDENYPAASSQTLSLQRIGALTEELDAWQRSMPSNLRLQFVQDKPSTNVVGSGAPLLSLAYHYIRTLIHRPAVGSTLGSNASSSVVALAGSSKHVIQIVQLLQERRMCFSFCLNKNELLMLAGFGLLYQGVDLDRKGKLIQDSQRLLCSVIEMLERHAAPGATEFKKVACAMMSIDRFSKSARALDEGTTRRKSDGNMAAPKSTLKSPRKQLQAMASRFTSSTPQVTIKRESSFTGRRATLTNVPNRTSTMYACSDDQNSVSSVVSDPTHVHGHSRVLSSPMPQRQNIIYETPNLDYLSFGIDQVQSSRSRGNVFKDYEADLTSFSPVQHLEAPYGNLYPSPDMVSAYISPSPGGTNYDWASDLLAMPPELSSHPASANSVLSFSEEEITSGEELSTCDLSGEYGCIAIPEVDDLTGLDVPNGDYDLLVSHDARPMLDRCSS